MSHIRWQSEHGEPVYIRGWERAWMDVLVCDLATTFVPSHDLDRLQERLVAGHYLLERPADWRFRDSVVTSLRAGFDGDGMLTDLDGTVLSTFSLLLNTVLAVGSDPVCLFARMHGQCEIHCYVEGSNRAWMADLVEAGRSSGVYRSGAGWEELVELLRARDDEPVVADYSVTDGFLNPPASWQPLREDQAEDWEAHDARSEAFDALPAWEQWDLAMGALRGEPDRGLEMSPGSLRERFGHERSLIDLFVASPAARVAL